MRHPSSVTGAATRQVVLRVTDEEREDLKSIARLEQRPVSEVIRDAINAYADEFRSELVFVRARPDYLMGERRWTSR